MCGRLHNPLMEIISPQLWFECRKNQLNVLSGSSISLEALFLFFYHVVFFENHWELLPIGKKMHFKFQFKCRNSLVLFSRFFFWAPWLTVGVVSAELGWKNHRHIYIEQGFISGGHVVQPPTWRRSSAPCYAGGQYRKLTCSWYP